MPVLILLSVLILTHFILADMGETKRSFALRKRMGIHDFQIGKITFLQASILLVCAVFLSLIDLGAALVSFSHIFGLSAFSFHPLILVILFPVSFVFSLCASLLSLVFFNRKSLVQLLD